MKNFHLKCNLNAYIKTHIKFYYMNSEFPYSICLTHPLDKLWLQVNFARNTCDGGHLKTTFTRTVYVHRYFSDVINLSISTCSLFTVDGEVLWLFSSSFSAVDVSSVFEC